MCRKICIGLACSYFLLGIITSEVAAREAKTVKFASGNREISAMLFEPSGSGPFPALIEIHGIFGREPWDLEVSEKLAQQGYLVLAVDLYGGRKAKDYYEGLRIRDQVRPRVAQDLRAAVAYLRTLQEVSAQRVGAIGWCMGGGFVLQLAIAEPTLAAGVIYYGPVVVDVNELKKVRARLLGLFGQEDRSIPVPAVRMMDNALRDAGDPMELHIYPEARHGFAQPDFRTDNAYLPDAAKDAWEKTLAFLSANLASKKR